MGDKKIYEKPSFINLNGFSASGQHNIDRGSCESGGALTSEFCKDGGAPDGGTCSPMGFTPERGYCDLGQKAVEGCTSGSIHT